MNVDAELILLRDFYEKWINYHSLLKGKPKDREAAGVRLVEAHNAIQLMYEPTESQRIMMVN